MKPSLMIFAVGIAVLPAGAQQMKDYPIQPVAFTHVHVNDQFWGGRLQVYPAHQRVEMGLVRLYCNEWKMK